MSSREYPVASRLGAASIENLIGTRLRRQLLQALSKAHGEGHAFGFVHQRLMREDAIVPIVPVALNTYFPPNQPRPKRCYELGQAIRRRCDRSTAAGASAFWRPAA